MPLDSRVRTAIYHPNVPQILPGAKKFKKFFAENSSLILQKREITNIAYVSF